MKTKKKDLLGKEKERLESQLSTMDPTSERYSKTLASLEELKRLTEEKKQKVSPDTWVKVAGMVSVFAVAYLIETKGDVILSTKPLQFLTKF